MTQEVSAAMRAAVAELRDRPLSVTDKGFGRLAAAGPVSAATLAATRPSLFGGDFVFPLLVLREAALHANIAAMASWCAAAGVRLAPHAKTTMAPQLIARQLAAGAWAVTAATIAQVQVYRAFGVPRVLLANELTDRGAIEWLAAELAADAGFECYVYADSQAGVTLLDSVLRQAWAATSNLRQLPVLVELGQQGGRTGCRSVAEALSVAAAVTATSTLRLAGVAGFEGNIGHDERADTPAAVARFCRDLRAVGESLPTAGPPAEPPILSAGGSSYFDVVVRQLTADLASQPDRPRPSVVLRSGAYVTHDHGLYARTAPLPDSGRDGPPLVPALELWAPVLSRPEPGLALVCAGRRDTSFDQGMPVPIAIKRGDGQQAEAAGLHVTELNDQHAYLHVPVESSLAPGDLVCFGISHPCTAFDKWRVIPVVDTKYQVIDAVHTFF